jgi:histidinol-phosphate aminotransferase
MSDYPFTPVVASLREVTPFVGPEALARQRGLQIRARMGANESVFGPSLQAIAAMRQAAAEVWKYGDPEVFELRDALAQAHGVTVGNITVGEGIDGLHGIFVRLFVAPGVGVVTSQGAYPTFNYHVAGSGGRLVTAPYRNDHEDPEALLALAHAEQARVVFLANPDNPMGTWWDAATVQKLIDGLPTECLLCLDEAYSDFAPEGTLPALDVTNSRVVRFRTFSKAHGMAGLRVGYAIGAAGVIRAFDRLRNHFGVGRIAQAGALAALGDAGHLAFVKAQVREGRDRIGAIARDNGLVPIPSATNFVAIDCGGDGAFARRVLDGVLARGIFIRMPGVAPLDRCIRVSVGTPENIDALAAVLPTALAAARRA